MAEATVLDALQITGKLNETDSITAKIAKGTLIEPLSCKVLNVSPVSASLAINNTISGKVLNAESVTATVSLPVVMGDDIYNGSYDVVPSFDTQTLKTKGRTMADNVTIEAIQVSRTSNPSGGTTVYIGGIVNG